MASNAGIERYLRMMQLRFHHVNNNENGNMESTDIEGRQEASVDDIYPASITGRATTTASLLNERPHPTPTWISEEVKTMLQQTSASCTQSVRSSGESRVSEHSAAAPVRERDRGIDSQSSSL